MSKKSLAVVFNGNLSTNRQGMLNSAISRAKYLSKLNSFDISVFCVHEYDCGLLRLLHHQSIIKPVSIQEIDGVSIRIIYKKRWLFSFVLESFIRITHIFSSLFYHRIASRFKEYDLIVGHSTIGGTVARMVNKRFGIPYCVVWHGSDIHTYPLISKRFFSDTKKIRVKASGNIFVSCSLLNEALRLFDEVPNPHIVFNAPSELFKRYDNQTRIHIREEKGVGNNRVIAFVGNLVPVKNVFSLPGIFKRVSLTTSNLVFWVIGDGVLRHSLERKMDEKGVSCVFWGNQQPENMPDYMNCIDILVLPSLNESFGMVLVEAITCGANVVGSNRGGIPEVIGRENCFSLGDSFEERISNRIVSLLNNPIYQFVNPEYNWERSANNECRIFSEILGLSKP